MSTDIPDRVRRIVRERDGGRCLRCGGPGSQMCHRRTRAVADGHQHCPCNLWLGCHVCHQEWQHPNPQLAMEKGFAISRHQAEPFTVPVRTWYGVLRLLCDGDVEFVVEEVGPWAV